MKTIRLTLRNRIVTLLTVVTVLLISSFAAIQLNNQLNNITLFNFLRARQGPIIVKNLLEDTINTALSEELNGKLQDKIDTISEKKIIDNCVVFDKYGTIVATSNPDLPVKSKLSREDIHRMNDLTKLKKAEGSFIDKTNRTVDIFFVLSGGYAGKITYSLGNIQEALNQVYSPVIITAIILILVNILLGYLLSKTVLGPIAVLNEATKDIAAGNLDLKVRINTRDELQELSETFNEMTAALKRMKAIAENANPLTHLPGNNVIREEVENRIRDDKKFVVVHTDLDNFKAFNDKYGLMKGDEAIILNCQILQEALKEKGNPDDFVGHEGGDDFVLVTTPDKDTSITNYIIQEFDKRARVLYGDDDLNRGHIIAKGRDGKVHEFPIMTISLSGVSNAHRRTESYAEVTNIAAEVKKKVKAVEKSVYFLDKRGGDDKTGHK